MAVPTPETQFTRDILGNYVCNTIAEATNSGPFDVIIIGGGTFGLVLAQDLFFRARTQGPGTIQQDGLKCAINVIGEKRATGQRAPQPSPSRVANAGPITSTQSPA